MVTALVPEGPTVARHVSENVERILQHGYLLGGVEGRLEGINIHLQPQFVVYDSVSGRAVRCYFSSDQLDDVVGAVGRKVLVSGNLRRDASGRPLQFRPVESFNIIDELPSATPRDPSGLYRGLLGETRSYLRMIRGE